MLTAESDMSSCPHLVTVLRSVRIMSSPLHYRGFRINFDSSSTVYLSHCCALKFSSFSLDFRKHV